MTNEKYLRLIERLVAKTNEGTANWEVTARDGMYALPGSKYSVAITKEWTSSDEWDVLIHLLDSVGDIVDTVRDTELVHDSPMPNAKFFQTLNELYDRARRKASGIEQALDSVLDELD